MENKPIAKVIGENGNVFTILAICTRALNAAGQKGYSRAMQDRVLASHSYNEALNIMREFCEFK